MDIPRFGRPFIGQWTFELLPHFLYYEWCCCEHGVQVSLWVPVFSSFGYIYTCKLKKAMATHSSTLAWKIPWVEEPGGLQSTGSLRVGHHWATSLSLLTFMHWRRKWQPTPVFLPGESQGRGAWWAAVYGVTQSRTRLKWLSSSSSSHLINESDGLGLGFNDDGHFPSFLVPFMTI